MSAAIEIQNLTFAYSAGMPDEKVALRDVSVVIEKGDFVGMIGHTGSGKSTLIQMMNGLLKPTAGNVLVDGEDIWQNKDRMREFRFKVGLVFQYPEYQIFEETVFKDIAYGPGNMGLAPEEIRGRVLRAASYVGLDGDVMERSPFDLSGGQKRRVAIAGVLAMQPEVLVLDEPTAGLDPAGRDEILGEIARFHREMGNTVILVSHSMDDVARYASKVLVLNEGALHCFGPAREIFERTEELESMGLAIPSATDVMLRLKRRGFDVDTAVYTVEDAAAALLKALGKGGGRHA